MDAARGYHLRVVASPQRLYVLRTLNVGLGTCALTLVLVSTEHHSKVRFQGTHPKLFAHRGGVRTASLGLAKASDDKIENHLGKWFTGHLISVERMEPGLRSALADKDWDLRIWVSRVMIF